MTNTGNTYKSIHPAIDGLPSAAFSVWDGDGIQFRVLADPSEAWQYLLAVQPFIAHDVSVIVEWISAAANGGHYDLVTVKVTNDEFQARPLADALNEALARVNAAG